MDQTTELTMLWPLLGMALRVEWTTGWSRTLGAPDGVTRASSKWKEAWTCAVLATQWWWLTVRKWMEQPTHLLPLQQPQPLIQQVNWNTFFLLLVVNVFLQIKDVSRRGKPRCVLTAPLLVIIRKTCQNRSVPNTAGVFRNATHGHFTTLAVATATPILLQTALNEMRDGSGTM